MKILANLKHYLSRHPGAPVFFLATGISVAFSLVVDQRMAESTSYRVAEDGYDQLARGLYLQGSFSYYPNPAPTVLRGPAYPGFIAVILAFNEHWYPLSVQIAQGLLHGLTCLLACRIFAMLFDPGRAYLAGLVCALHPYLLWYASRVVTETFSTFLFTLIIYFVISLLGNQKAYAPFLLGGTLGLAALCKSSFLPLAIGMPFLLFHILPAHVRLRSTVIIVGMALVLVAPWTLRNYVLTNQLIPVHSLLGYNLRIGDVQAEFYERAPFSYFQLLSFKQHDISSHGDIISHPWMRDSETMVALQADNELLMRSLERYIHEPTLVLRKLLLGPIMFWTLSSTPATSAFASALQIPLLILLIVSAVRVVKLHGALSRHAIPLVLLTTYFAIHIPIMAVARFSVVLIPTMVIYVIDLLPKPNMP